MQLTQVDYTKICNLLGITPNYTKGYNYADNIYNNNYVNRIFNKYINSLKAQPEKIILFFLESCPSNMQNYIFDNLQASVTSKSYLNRICTGFGINPNNLNKQDCLELLLKYKTNKGENIPVVLIDLFPFHGIKLNTNTRKKICQNISNPNVLKDALFHINNFISRLNNPNILCIFGVPPTIWNCSNDCKTKFKLSPINNHIINIGGQNLSSNMIKQWRKQENID